jgi:DNA repair exonuclease SbcCD ATPase subunit
MADDLSFTISAEDQASKAVETVQKKIQNFGSDIAKLALGVAGPMAVLQAGIGYVSDKWAEYQQAQKDAFENGAKGTYDEVKAQEALGEQLDKNLSVLLAMAKVKAENAKNADDVKNQENQAIQAFLQTEAGMKFKQQHTVQSTDESYYVATREQELAAARAEGEKQLQKINDEKYGPNSTEESRARIDKARKDAEEQAKKAESKNSLENIAGTKEKINALQADLANGGPLTGSALIDSLKEKVKYAQEEYDIIKEGQSSEIERAEALKKLLEAQVTLRNEQTKQAETQAKIDEQKAKEAEAQKKTEEQRLKAIKDADKLTVSSLREIGGSFGGGDVNTSMNTQIELAQKQVEALNKIVDNTQPRENIGTPSNLGGTNFTLPEININDFRKI